MITPLPPYPAALIRSPGSRTIVIADLHIGWEATLSDRGIHVPSQTHRLLEKLKELLHTYNPERLLILGDVKHTVATAEKIEWKDVPDFFSELRNHCTRISIVCGNHDGNLEPLLPEKVELLRSKGFSTGDVGLFHGHQWPSPDLLKCRTLVMGHVHPVVVFRDPTGFRVTRQVWVKVNCHKAKLTEVLLRKNRIKVEEKSEAVFFKLHKTKPRTTQLFIMPSFNDFLGGRPLNDLRPRDKLASEVISGPILRSDAVDMQNAETYLLDGTFLGTLEQLKTLSKKNPA